MLIQHGIKLVFIQKNIFFDIILLGNILKLPTYFDQFDSMELAAFKKKFVRFLLKKLLLIIAFLELSVTIEV